MTTSIRIAGNSLPQMFAAQELSRYLLRMMPDLRLGGGKSISLGLLEDFGLAMAGLEDRRYDDAFVVDIDGLSGIIAGSNDRSILFGVYRFLEQAGCHWARHGADGEYIPERDIRTLRVRMEDRASYRHRGLCIEGAVSIENMLDNIAWAPKAGFNSYFLEFFTPYTFFERFYSHRHSASKEAEPLSVDTVKGWTRQLEGEISKRGLLYHAVGHAWTCEALGLEGLDWNPGEHDLSDDKKQMLALVNGEREVWKGVPINTNLCYSNPEARGLVVKSVVGYLASHDCVDFLHVWLADDINNHCECEGCKGTLPSDFYVMLLNEIDAALTELGDKTRIVFLAYVDLLWAPKQERFTNPDRFAFLFAPITRTYTSTYDYNTDGVELPEYDRNHLALSKTVAENIAHMDRWRETFCGDSLAYEYHFMWDHLFDPGYYMMTEVLSQDIKSMHRMGLNGLISDQCQRSFFPTGFPMFVMGRTLWNERASLDDLAREYFAKTFGDDGEECRAYLSEISRLFDQVYMRGDKVGRQGSGGSGMDLWGSVGGSDSDFDPEVPTRLAAIPGVVEAFRPTVQRNIAETEGGMQSSWRYLAYHGDIVTGLSLALLELETGSREQARRLWDDVVRLASQYEDALQPVFDLFEFVEVLGRRFQLTL